MRVMSGSEAIIRAPIAAHCRPWGSAARRMRRTLYCVDVTPHSRVLCWNARSRKSEVRKRFKTASSSRPEKGAFCWISCFSLPIGESPRESCSSLEPAHGPTGVPTFRTPARSDKFRLAGARLLLYHLKLDVECDFIAKHRGGIFGANAEHGAVEFGFSRIAGMHPAFWVGNCRRGSFYFEHHRLGDAVKRKVSGDFKLASIFCDARARERRRGKIGDIEEVGALEIVVALIDAGVDGCDTDGCRDCGFGDISFIQDDGGVDRSESAVDF